MNLIFIYPRWNVSQAIWWQYLFPVATLIAFRHILVTAEPFASALDGISLLYGNAFPVLGFFNVYPFRFSFVADHFQYLACIAPIALFVGSTSTVVLLKKNTRIVLL